MTGAAALRATLRATLTVTLAATLAFMLGTHAVGARAADYPNIVVIFCDDLGYGDLSCYGHPTIRTPQLDRMAAEGMLFTQFYCAAEVCTPSRAALLTGRLPPRNGMCSNRRRVLFPDSNGGLQADQITVAEVLKRRDYATACIGKWHLGHLPPYLPMEHGFDEYYGIPYSNDMDRVAESPAGREAFWEPRVEYWNVPLMRGSEIIERPVDQTTITERYTRESIEFIQRNRERPFFLYLAHTMPHVPLFRSEPFAGQSDRGLYGDVVEEIDSGVGRILQTLRDEGLAENTFVLFTSDNGPWLIFNDHGGSAGLLRDGKGSTWEGGMRVPGIVWWPGTVPAGTRTHELGSTLDLWATAHAVADLPLPTDYPHDSHNLLPLLRGEGPSSRQEMVYYRGFRLMAYRQGPWKLHLMTQNAYGQPEPEKHDPPLLFQLEQDPSERNSVTERHPEVVQRLLDGIERHRAGMVPMESQLER